jgi:uncharacterized protein HemX
MPYVLVLLVAAAAGGGVAFATLRRGDVTETSPQTWTKGYEEPEDDQPEEETAGATGRPRKPLPSTPTARTRVSGAVGLLLVVLVAAGLIAGAALVVWDALRNVWKNFGA